MITNKICKDCGIVPEDAKGKFLYVVIDERRIPVGLCESCLNKRLGR